MNNETVNVAAIMPFFRYAVGPTSGLIPAIPYFTRKHAEAFYEETKRELPWMGVIMYRRTWRGLQPIRQYHPYPKPTPALCVNSDAQQETTHEDDAPEYLPCPICKATDPNFDGYCQQCEIPLERRA